MCYCLLKYLGMKWIVKCEIVIPQVNLRHLSYIQRDCLSVCGLYIFKNNLFTIFDDELDEEGLGTL